MEWFQRVRRKKQQPIVMPPPAPREISRDMVVEWLRERGLRHLDQRVTERPWGFQIDNQPDEYLDGDPGKIFVGGGPYILVKRTGGIWYFPSRPEFFPIYDAKSEEHLYTTMRDVYGDHFFDPAQPHDWFPAS